MITIRKSEIAMVQLIAAIKMFESGEYVPSVTLAGVAEEILAETLRRRSKAIGIPVPTSAETECFMFESVRGLMTTENYYQQRNWIRNEFKHFDGKYSGDSVIGDFTQAALTHICGSIINYKLANGCIPLNPDVERFCSTYGIS